jgi:uncharacterized protein YydD (DUF2326 family)
LPALLRSRAENSQIFDETKTYLPGKLYSDYDQLVEFNKRVTQERNKLLRRQIKDLETQQATLEAEGTRFNAERVQALALVRSANTFDKFKGLQKEFAKPTGRTQLPPPATHTTRKSNRAEQTTSRTRTGP